MVYPPCGGGGGGVACVPSICDQLPSVDQASRIVNPTAHSAVYYRPWLDPSPEFSRNSRQKVESCQRRK